MRLPFVVFGAGLAALAVAVGLSRFPDISDGPQVLALGGLVFVLAAGATSLLLQNSVWLKLALGGNLAVLVYAIDQWWDTYQRAELGVLVVPLVVALAWMGLRYRLASNSGS